MEHTSKELPLLDILIKTKMAKSPLISTTNPSQYPHFKSYHSKNCLEILDSTEVIKSQRQPKNLKKYSVLLHSQHHELENAKTTDVEYVI